jgi:MYXO-CTERM domain-containing protein
MTLNHDGRYLGAGAFGRGAWIYDFGSAAKTPPTKVPTLPGTGRLSTTGLDPMWPIAGVVLIGAAALIARRRRSTPAT